MEKAEPPGPRYPPADLRRRALARAIDFAVALAPLLLVPASHFAAALVLSAALLLCGDRLFGPGRSLGKRLAGLRCIVLASRRPAPLAASLRRNAIFACALVAAFLAAPSAFPAASPAFPGGSAAPAGAQSLAGPRLLWALAFLGGAGLLETAVLLQRLTVDPGRRRLGDLFAGTQVIDASLALGLTVTDPKLVPAAAPLASRAARIFEAVGHGLWAVTRIRRPVRYVFAADSLWNSQPTHSPGESTCVSH